MSTSQQRWLSRDGICTTLQFSRNQIQSLVRQGVLVAIGSGANRRYLDPTQEFAAKLKLGETVYGRLYPLPRDIDLSALFTIREVAEILGITHKTAQNYSQRGKLKHIKVGIYRMYTVETIRKILWKRDGRSLSKQRAPFLLSGLIEFFMKRYKSDNEIMPTDAEFAEDELLMRKFQRLMKMPSPQREEAMQGLWKKIEMAKAVAQAHTSQNKTRP